MRISGINIPDGKQLKFSLTSVYGIGNARAITILKELKIDPLKKVPELTTDEENAIREKVESFTIEGELKREVGSNIKRLKDIQAYRVHVMRNDFLLEDSERRQTHVPSRELRRPWDQDAVSLRRLNS